MNAIGRTVTVTELIAEAPWSAISTHAPITVRFAGGEHLGLERVDYEGQEIVLTLGHDSAQVHLNTLVADLGQIIDLNPTKAVLLEQLTKLYEQYEVETT